MPTLQTTYYIYKNLLGRVVAEVISSNENNTYINTRCRVVLLTIGLDGVGCPEQ
jgi:hypothetical protein